MSRDTRAEIEQIIAEAQRRVADFWAREGADYEAAAAAFCAELRAEAAGVAYDTWEARWSGGRDRDPDRNAGSAAPVTQFASGVPADAEAAAKLALAASVAAGNPISQRQMMTRFGLTRTAERKVRQAVLAEANGHAPDHSGLGRG